MALTTAQYRTMRDLFRGALSVDSSNPTDTDVLAFFKQFLSDAVGSLALSNTRQFLAGEIARRILSGNFSNCSDANVVDFWTALAADANAGAAMGATAQYQTMKKALVGAFSCDFFNPTQADILSYINFFGFSLVLGYVGTRTMPHSVASALTDPYAFRFPWFATDDLSGTLSAAWTNWYGPETDPLSTLTIEAYLEYPAGTLTRMKFGGGPMVIGASNVGTAPTKTNIWGSCTIPGTIPSGTLCWLRYYLQGSALFMWNGPGPNLTLGEAGVSNSTTLTGTMTSNWGYISRPAAIVGYTRKKSYAVIGDSLQVGNGQADSIAAPGNLGQISRGFGAGIGYADFGVGGSISTDWIASHTLRDELINPYAYGVLDGYGTNDIFVGHVSAATLKTRQQTIRALYPSKPFYVKTIDPQTTSTDSWATLANQTVKADEAARVAYNADLRASPTGIGTGIIDSALASESGSTGKWIVTGAANYATADGTHPSEAMYQLYSFPGFGGLLP